MTEMIATYGPAGLGGAILGVSAGLFYFLDGRITGISSILRRALAPDGRWRIAFILGLLAAGVILLVRGGAAPAALQDSTAPVLAVGGLLVGIGAGVGAGCTSGHGVCGLARLSVRSFVAVAVFMSTAALTVFVSGMVR